MKEESLERANEIKKEIEALEQHLSIFIKDTKTKELLTPEVADSIPIYFKVSRYNFSDKDLIKDLMPISNENFIRLYVSNIQSEIKKLEKEFEKL